VGLGSSSLDSPVWVLLRLAFAANYEFLASIARLYRRRLMTESAAYTYLYDFFGPFGTFNLLDTASDIRLGVV